MTMNTKSNIILGQDAVYGMMQGITTVTNLIRPTFGGKGTNVIVESTLRPGHGIYNDAQTITQAIFLNDPAQKRGLAFIKELCDKADKLSGDARKTTIILCEEILKLGYETNVNKLQLKEQLESLIPFIEKEIDKQTVQITVDTVENVATTACENKTMGKLIQEIYQKIGKDGIIHVEGSGTYETSYKFIDGVRFDMTGYISPSLKHNDSIKAIYENPVILVTKKKIVTDDDINPLLREMITQGKKDLIIFTHDMDSDVASMLINLHTRKEFNICIIQPPTLWRDYIYEDFAKCVGATIIDDSTGKTFKNLTENDLGTCTKIIIDSNETILMGTKDISNHIEILETKNDDDSNLRLTWLKSRTAILKIGSSSDSDLSYKKLKTHDGIRSSQLALKYGIVKGGGLCLDLIALIIPDTPGSDIITKALRAPLIQNKANGCETIPDNIVDASMVIKYAVRNAVGIASTILTANGLIYLPELQTNEPFK